jgi:hypothetical protein
VTFLAIASEGVRSFFYLSGHSAEHVIGIFGSVVLVGSIAELHFGWREKSAKHSEAANSLARVKFLISRDLSGSAEISRAKYAELQQLYEDACDLVTKIPERRFLALKAAHRRKVELSKMLDVHPGASVFLLKAKLWLRDNLRQRK